MPTAHNFVAPALTPEQWAKARVMYSLPLVQVGDVETPNEYRAAIAVLLDALAQAGEPLLTHEDVERIRSGARYAREDGMYGDDYNLRTLALRITSLLPPEGV